MAADRILYLALVISIIGLLILAYVSDVLEPPLVSIKDIGMESLGKNVHVRGNITKLREFKGGSMSLLLKDDTAQISVYLPYSVAVEKNSTAPLKKGDVVDVIGVVEVYRNEIEVVVENPDYIKDVQ